MPSRHPRLNGSKQWLLWLNTALTAFAAFIGSQLWYKVDKINDAQIRSEGTVNGLLYRETELEKRLERLEDYGVDKKPLNRYPGKQ